MESSFSFVWCCLGHHLANEHFFAKNVGQLQTSEGTAAVHYYLNTNEGDVFLTNRGIEYQFYASSPKENNRSTLQGHSLGMRPVGQYAHCLITSSRSVDYVIL